MKNFIMIIILLTSVIISCGQVKTVAGNTEIFERAKRNIIIAESLSDLKRRDDLLKQAEADLKNAEAAISEDKKKSQNTITQDAITSGYAYLNYVNGNLSASSQLAAKITNQNDPFINVLKARISLRESGRDYAAEGIDILKLYVNEPSAKTVSNLTLGDCYFLLGNFKESRFYFTEVLKIGQDFQVQAADRLEILDEIDRTNIDTKKVQKVLFSNAIKRDELADLIERVYYADKYIKFGNTKEQDFTDISSSAYSESIIKLRKIGFFSYIQSDKFDPGKPVTRGELARAIEDYFVLNTGNNSIRTRYSKDSKSPVKGIDVKDPYYNAIRIAIAEKSMDLSLEGVINPLEPVSGIECLSILSKTIIPPKKKGKKEEKEP